MVFPRVGTLLLAVGVATVPRTFSLEYAGATPNIVIVLTDDQGWGDVQYNNVTERQYQQGGDASEIQWNPPRTPNLDKMAASPHSLLLHRFYSSSPVCSPTRSAMLTGRTPNRECIFDAQGCGQQPAWECNDPAPLPPTVFTVAQAAKLAGMDTAHIGKWHLGNFFPMDSQYISNPTYAYGKWPVSHPGIAGFDFWHSTEASASVSGLGGAVVGRWTV